MKISALYPAPESDEWEEIECDEVIQNITIHIHVCPHQNMAVLVSLTHIFVKNFYLKCIIILITTNFNLNLPNMS